MNYPVIASGAEDASGLRDVVDRVAVQLHDAVHTLAQPLTALAFLLEFGRMQNTPLGWRSTVEDASAECRRAFLALQQMREAVHALDDAGGRGQ